MAAASRVEKSAEDRSPQEYRYGFGSRYTAVAAEVAGIAGNSSGTVRTFCPSVPGARISLGTLQKLIDRMCTSPIYLYERFTVMSASLDEMK